MVYTPTIPGNPAVEVLCRAKMLWPKTPRNAAVVSSQ